MNKSENLFQLHRELCSRALDIMKKKNHDYAGGNGPHQDCFANFRGSSYLGINPIMGILLRVQDKIMRIRTFAEKGKLKVADESVEDAILDVINYMILVRGLSLEGEPIKDESPQSNGDGWIPWDAPEDDIPRKTIPDEISEDDLVAIRLANGEEDQGHAWEFYWGKMDGEEAGFEITAYKVK